MREIFTATIQASFKAREYSFSSVEFAQSACGARKPSDFARFLSKSGGNAWQCGLARPLLIKNRAEKF